MDARFLALYRFPSPWASLRVSDSVRLLLTVLPVTPQTAGSDSESLVSSGETERSAWSAGSVTSGEDSTLAPDSGLFLYMDMHGHASKRGEDADKLFIINMDEEWACA